MTEIVRPCVLSMIAPFVIVDDGSVVAACTDPITARRLLDLYDRHGLVDVPDTAEGAHG